MDVTIMAKMPRDMTPNELKLAIKIAKQKLRMGSGKAARGSMRNTYYNGGINPHSRSSEGRKRQRALTSYLDILTGVLAYQYFRGFVGADPKNYPPIIDQIDTERDNITERLRLLDLRDESRRERIRGYKRTKSDKFTEALLATVEAAGDYSPHDPLGSASSTADAVKATAEAIKNDYDTLIDATTNHQSEMNKLENELSDLEALKEQLEKAHRAAIEKREAQRKAVKEQAERKKREAKKKRRIRNEESEYRRKHGASAYGDRNYRDGRRKAGLDDDGVLA